MDDNKQAGNNPVESNQPEQVSVTPPTPGATIQPGQQTPVSPKSNKKLSLILSIVFFFLLIGGAAYYWFFMKDDNKQQATTTTPTQPAEQPKVSETPKEEDVPPNSIKFTDSKTGLTFYYPEDITGKFTVSTYRINEDIGKGYGSPVWWRYTSSSDSWQTYRLSDKSTEDNITKVKTTNTFKILEADVSGKKAILDKSGEGGTASNIILFAYNGKLYKVDMPQLSWQTNDEDKLAKTDAQNKLQKDSAEQIVETIKFN